MVTANPRSSEAELAGLAAQVEPRVVVTDDEVPALAGVSGAASIPLAGLFADVGKRRVAPVPRARTTRSC